MDKYRQQAKAARRRALQERFEREALLRQDPCSDAVGRVKKAFPTQEAALAAAFPSQEAYRCRGHWHLRSRRKR